MSTSTSSSSTSIFRGIRLPPNWLSFDDSLLVRIYSPIMGRKSIQLEETASKVVSTKTKLKIAGFDFDDTLVRKHDSNLAYPTVLEKLRSLSEQHHFRIAIFSNESLDHFKSVTAIKNAIEKKTTRLDTFVEQLNLPIMVFVATRYDSYRKPSTQDEQKRKPKGGAGMWNKLIELSNISASDIDMDNSFFVGDASGKRGEFSDTDLMFAKCIEISFIHSDDYFRSRTETVTGPKALAEVKQLVVEVAPDLEQEIIIVDDEPSPKIAHSNSVSTVHNTKRVKHSDEGGKANE